MNISGYRFLSSEVNISYGLYPYCECVHIDITNHPPSVLINIHDLLLVSIVIHIHGGK